MREIRKDNAFVYYKIQFRDLQNRERIKRMGGIWEPKEKIWKVPRDHVEPLRHVVARAETMNLNAERLISDYKFKDPQPYRHQLETIKQSIEHRQFGLFLEMGLGKTRCIIETLQILKNCGAVRRTIVLAPKTLLSVWEEEIEKWGRNLTSAVATGTPTQKKKALESSKDVIITNYESLLSSFTWPTVDCVVLDESQKIKDHKSKRTRKLIGKSRLFGEAEFRFILTGTPITQSPLDVFTQMKFLNSQAMGVASYYAFRSRYAVMGGYMNYQIVSYQNIDDLMDRLKKHAITLLKADCLDLPQKIFEKRIIDMSPDMKQQYSAMRKDLIIEVGGKNITATIVLTKMLRLQQILAGEYLDDKKNNKLQELISVVKDHGPGVVVWCRFVHSIKTIKRNLEALGFKVGALYGAVSQEDRKEMIRGFQAGEVDIFIGQITAGGVGITLVRSSFVVIYENNFSLQDRLQFEDRTHRIGMKKACVYIDLIYDKTIDQHVLQAIKQKHDVAKSIIGNIKTLLY